MPSRNKNKKKQQKKSRQQLKKDRNKLKAQNKHQNDHKKKKNKGNKWNEYSNLPHTELLQILQKGYKELNVDSIQSLKRSRKNLKFKQQVLAECFNFVWTKCNNNVCTKELLSKKLILLTILLKYFKLDLSASQNFFSPNDDDTLYDRTSLLCHKCLLPMIQFNLDDVALSDSYLSSLKLLILQQLHFSLFQYVARDGVGDDILCNRSDILHACWDDTIKPKLDGWWISQVNFRTKTLTNWAVYQGVYLDVVFPYFSMFKDFIMNGDKILNTDIPYNECEQDFFDPLNLSIHEKENVNELGIPEFIYMQLAITLGRALLKRKKLFENDEFATLCNIDVIYDRDLEYVYMRIAHLFDEGRLKWLQTEKGHGVYQSYVNIINRVISADYPLIGKIVTTFLIGEVETLDHNCVMSRNNDERAKWKQVSQNETFYNQSGPTHLNDHVEM